MTRKLSSPENILSTSLIVDEIFLSDCLSEKQIKNNIRFKTALYLFTKHQIGKIQKVSS